MKIIVGLGNPGIQYCNTRHNVGFMVIDSYLKKLGITDLKEKFGGLYAIYNLNGEKIMFLKPMEYINLSGDVLKKYVDYFNIDINDILIINDDMDLPIGSYKLKQKGSSAGHNGLKNIEQNLGTDEYKRLKIGISNNKNIDAKDYVLGKFSKEDKEILDGVIKISMNILDDYLKINYQDLMAKYNKK